MNRIRIEPRSRTNPGRKGAPMQTQIVQPNLDPEQVWGVEALDPLQQRAWAQALWQRWYHTAPPHRPLLLRYHPSAERAAMRALNTFARLSRNEETPPWIVLAEPNANSFLAPAPNRALSLCLIHRASRFVNLEEWLAQTPSARRIVLTMPEAEAKISSVAQLCERIEIPAEETSYADKVAQEILQKYFGENATLSLLEKILIESGIAEVALPMSLLARQLQCEPKDLLESLQRSRLRAFIFWLDEKPERTLAFRGAWLARELMPQQANGEYDTLLAMMSAINAEAQAERNFLLHLFMALQAQGHRELVAQLQKEYARLFEQVREQLDACDEREAWAHFERLLYSLRVGM